MRIYVIACILIVLGLLSMAGSRDSYYSEMLVPGTIMVCSGCICLAIGDLKTFNKDENNDQ